MHLVQIVLVCKIAVQVYRQDHQWHIITIKIQGDLEVDPDSLLLMFWAIVGKELAITILIINAKKEDLFQLQLMKLHFVKILCIKSLKDHAHFI